MTQKSSLVAPLIAVVGCDGSGKSTLSADLLEWLNQSDLGCNVETHYLGLRSGDMGNRIKGWPIIGKAFEAYLSKKAGQAKRKDAKIPGAPTAFVIYIFSVIRKRRFDAMMQKRRSGTMIVTDRYPQTDVPGFYDGPGLSAARAEGAVVKWLVKRERSLYEEMTSVVPDIVIRLNVDLETAFARKPDHKLPSLKAKVAATPKLTFNGAEIHDVSSLIPYDEMLAGTKRIVAAKLYKLGFKMIAANP